LPKIIADENFAAELKLIEEINALNSSKTNVSLAETEFPALPPLKTKSVAKGCTDLEKITLLKIPPNLIPS
jgi:hypothetical protein